MKYKIEHLLAGIKVARQQRISQLGQEIIDKRTEIVKLEDRAYDAVLKYRALLEITIQNLSTQKALYRQSERVEGEAQLFKTLPYEYDVGNREKELKNLYLRKTGLESQAQTEDSALELFLEAVAVGGETHLTQNALKQAGYDVACGEFIVAYNQERKAQDA